MHCHMGHSSSTPHSLHFPNVTRESGWSNTVGSIVVVKSLNVELGVAYIVNEPVGTPLTLPLELPLTNV